MKLPVAATWVFPYLVAIGVAVQFSIGFPTSFVPYLVVFACCIAVALYGIFFTEVTRYVFKAHPFQTTIYGTMISSVLLTILTLAVLLAFAIPGFIGYEGNGSGWAMLYIIATLMTVIPATAASSLIAIPWAHTLIRKRTEQAGDLKPDHVPS
tara:strand:- start:3099 stop:3557 length:459 start_codon:yes stop_codon:yes gene_type:complete